MCIAVKGAPNPHVIWGPRASQIGAVYCCQCTVAVVLYLPTMAFDPEYVDILFKGRSLGPTTSPRLFCLILQTVILVSTCGTVALPDSDDGSFFDLDSTLSWIVEGDKSSHGSTARPTQLVMQSTCLGSSLSQRTERKRKDGSQQPFHHAALHLGR